MSLGNKIDPKVIFWEKYFEDIIYIYCDSTQVLIQG